MTELDFPYFAFCIRLLRAMAHADGRLQHGGGRRGSLAAIPLIARSRTRRLGTSLAAVLLVTTVLVFALKRLVGRIRPFGVLSDVHALVFRAPTDCSFPSGHAAGSFAFSVFLGVILVRATPKDAGASVRLLRWGSALLLLVGATAVGLSRIALGVHFPTDVLAGALLGSVVALIGASFHLGATR